MTVTYREYTKADYAACENLVNQAWDFDHLFRSQNLCTLAKYLYTQGAQVASNYHWVAVQQHEVIGFIFGYNSSQKNGLAAIGLGLKATFDLNVKAMDKDEQKTFIRIIKAHQANRARVAVKTHHEIVLFVVAPECQGQGIGSQLWQGFRECCTNADCPIIQVETNKRGASAFYEKLGFSHRADFDSPLHNKTTPGGQACVYEFVRPPIAQGFGRTNTHERQTLEN